MGWAGIELYGPGDAGRFFSPLRDPDGDHVYQYTFTFRSIDEPGHWLIRTEYYSSPLKGGLGVDVPGPYGSFDVKYATALSVKASARSVPKGRAVTLSGRLRALDPLFGYAGHPYRTVRIYFRKKGAKKWVYKASAGTDAKGAYRKRVKVTATGSWAVKFAGDYDHASVRRTTSTIKAR